MFAYDPHTNRLSLQPGRQPPWIRKSIEQGHSVVKHTTRTWQYCLDCEGRWCPDTPQRPKAYLPFRDRASQFNMRPHRPHQTGSPYLPKEDANASQQNTQPEPEPEDADVDECGSDVALPMEEDADPEDEIALPMTENVPDAPRPAAYPTLEEYKKQWAERLKAHAKPTNSNFSLSVLVPRPIANLWQDCETHSFA